MIATLSKLAAIPTRYAFNLGIATLFALTASGAFSVVYNMVAVAVAARSVAQPDGRSSGRRRAARAVGKPVDVVVLDLESIELCVGRHRSQQPLSVWVSWDDTLLIVIWTTIERHDNRRPIGDDLGPHALRMLREPDRGHC